jgi:imidazolonepropionase-like amidohydrolase
MRWGRRAVLVSTLSFLAISTGFFSPALADVLTTANSAHDVILDGVTIVNTRDGSLGRGMAILLSDGKIAKIARAHTLKVSAGATLIDARGKFVVPGYLDMHNHVLNSPGPEHNLPLMVANGITGYRQMAGSPQLLAARKNGTLPHPMVAPELLAMPGTVLAGPFKSNPQAAIAEVDAQKAQGADFIKTVDQDHDAFFAALDRAHADGLPFAGHLPPSVDVREAAHRGMLSIEHLGPTVSILEACSTDELAIRQSFAQAPPATSAIKFDLPLAELKKLTANPLLLMSSAAFLRAQHVLDTFDDAKCRALAKTLAATDTWQVPTLIRLKAMEFGDDSAFKNDPNIHYALSDDRALWRDVGNSFAMKLSQSDRATLKQLFADQIKLVKLFDNAGVKMLTGTDFGGQWLVAGFSLHQEFDLLAQAGLSPLKVLQMTTLNGAKFLHRDATMGTVEVGKDANLVLLDANPIASVQNLHRIDAVVRGGVYYSRDDLDQIEQRAFQP